TCVVILYIRVYAFTGRKKGMLTFLLLQYGVRTMSLEGNARADTLMFHLQAVAVVVAVFLNKYLRSFVCGSSFPPPAATADDDSRLSKLKPDVDMSALNIECLPFQVDTRMAGLTFVALLV